MTDRRFIEESFPAKEVGEISAKEKNIRHGNISTLHIWWARRPLAASRATAYAALTPSPTSIEEWQKKRDFIIELSKWENSNNPQLMERARLEILDANGGIPPKVLDPFAGGGSYPLEALRLGCEAYANDYNPVAVLIEKATLEYPQMYGRSFEGMPDWALPGATEKRFRAGKHNSEYDEGTEDKTASQPSFFVSTEKNEDVLKDHNPLLEGVRYWGKWVLEEARKELAEFYPPDPDGSIPFGYIWARTISCQNPACGEEIPLMRQFWLVKKDKKKIALYPKITKGKLDFCIVGDGHEKWPTGFDADMGTISRAVAICPVCGAVVDDDTTRRLFQEKKIGQKLLVVVLSNLHKGGRTYRVCNPQDLKNFSKAEKLLEIKRNKLIDEWGLDPIPDEPTPTGGGSGAERAFSIRTYGLNTWGDIFNSRQLLALISLIEKIRLVYSKIERQKNFAEAVSIYLGMAVNRLATRNSNLSVWHRGTEGIEKVYALQALPMQWEYPESNVLSTETVAGFIQNIESICSVLTEISNIGRSSIITQGTATRLPYPDQYFDAILTDPPYYDNIPYSYLSDFFYVWFKRSLGYIFPELFTTPLTPKVSEIVAYSNQDGGFEAGKKKFETDLGRSFQEAYRILKDNGVAIVVYAHKSTEGWETVINALLDSGLVVTSAWPLNTEQQSRLRASESAVLASSIYIVVRKMPRKPTGFYNDVRTELRNHLDTKLQRLWGEGIGGADFFIAAIGSAIEVFGKYEQVMDYEGNIVRADRLLDEVRTIATDYAVRQILHNGFAAEISDLSRFYVLWRWNYGEALVPFDEARKLAQSCGIDLTQQWGKNKFIKKEKEFMRVLGPQNRKLNDLDDPRDLIDVLHKVLLLWEQSKRVEMIQTLAVSGHGKSEAFYRVAQAISETLPIESKEKKLLDGFLAGRERVQQEVEKVATQGRLWE